MIGVSPRLGAYRLILLVLLCVSSYSCGHCARDAIVISQMITTPPSVVAIRLAVFHQDAAHSAVLGMHFAPPRVPKIIGILPVLWCFFCHYPVLALPPVRGRLLRAPGKLGKLGDRHRAWRVPGHAVCHYPGHFIFCSNTEQLNIREPV